jgi:hypothetical protein
LLQEGLFHASFDFGSYQLRVHHPRFSGLGVVPPSDSELALFEARLTGGDVSEPHEKLMMEAVLQVDRHRDFDLAIVHGETAFEVFVQKMLANYCQKNKVQALPGKKAASLGNQQAIETGNIQNDLFRYIEHCTGFDVKSTPEYNAWLNDAYNPRVAIIHRGARGMSEAQAKKALDTINAIMSVVRKLLT